MGDIRTQNYPGNTNTPLKGYASILPLLNCFTLQRGRTRKTLPSTPECSYRALRYANSIVEAATIFACTVD